MLNRKIQPALMIALVLILTAVLTFSFSPTVRAAMQAFFTFNGVSVGFDEQTGKLVISGNKDAVVEQTDNSVTIQGENGELAMAGAARALPAKMVDVSDLLKEFPGLVLPTAPAGYTMQAQGQLMDDGSLIFTWQDAENHMISYQVSRTSLQDPQLGSLENSGSIELSATGASTTGTTVSSSAEISPDLVPSNGSTELNPLVSYSWQAGGYYHMLFTSDPNLDEAALKAMLP